MAKAKRSRRAFGQVLLRKRSGARRATWCIRYRDHDGVERWESIAPDPVVPGLRLTAEDRARVQREREGIRRECTQRLTEIRLALLRDERAPEDGVRRVTFGDFWPTAAEAFRTGRKEIGLRPHGADTLATDETRYRVLAAHFGARVLCELTRADVAEALRTLQAERGLSPASCNRYVALLGAVYRVAQGERPPCATDNPVKGWRYEREPEKDVPLLDRKDLDRILAHVRPDEAAAVALLAETGARRSEVCRLRWCDVRLSEPSIFIPTSKTERARTIPLTPRAAALLARLREARGTVSLAETELVFPAIGDAKRWKVTQAFKAAAVKAGFPTLSLHGLRHSWASNLRRLGVSEPDVGRLLGDTTSRVVARYSKHAPENAGRQAVAMLAKAWGEGVDEGVDQGVDQAVKRTGTEPGNGAGTGHWRSQ